MDQGIFSNKRVIDVPQTAASSIIIHTTTADSLVYFKPRGANMESDSLVGIYVENYFTDTDGQVNHPWIFMVYDQKATSPNGGGNINGFALTGAHPASDHGQNINTSMIVPAGKNIRTHVTDSSDRIGGTLVVLELAL